MESKPKFLTLLLLWKTGKVSVLFQCLNSDSCLKFTVFVKSVFKFEPGLYSGDMFFLEMVLFYTCR